MLELVRTVKNCESLVRSSITVYKYLFTFNQLNSKLLIISIFVESYHLGQHLYVNYGVNT